MQTEYPARPYFSINDTSSGLRNLWLNGPWKTEITSVISTEEISRIQITWDPRISVHAPKGSADVSFVELLPSLSGFLIYCSERVDLSPIASLQKLSVLEIECPKLAAPFPVTNMANLAYLHIVWHRHLAPLMALKNLTTLKIQNYPFENLVSLSHMKKLKVLEIIGSRKLLSLAGLAELPLLESLFVDRSPNLGDISAIQTIPFRGDVTFESCKLVTDMGF
ncbi:MAG: hypothetical protein LW838_00720 [Nitrosomonadaceae bacterium]|nr:hypothetical protein [Nitrosomonadaceae bacterium]